MKTGEKKQHWAKKKEEKKIIVPKFRNFFRLATVSHILTFIFGAVLIYSLFFADFLRINDVDLTGNNSIPSEQLNTAIENELNAKYWKIFSRGNFIFLNSSKLERNLKTQFKKIKKISVEKKFPSRLKIEMEERNLILFLCSRGDCYFIDENGYAYKKADSSEMENQGGPIVKLIDGSGKDINEGEYVLLPRYVDFIIKIEEAVKTETGLEILNEYRTESRISEEVIVQTKKGWDIYLNSKFPIEKSVYTLKTLLNRQIMLKELNDLEYIDLRSENKVFYRMIGGVVQEEEELKKESEELENNPTEIEAEELEKEE